MPLGCILFAAVQSRKMKGSYVTEQTSQTCGKAGWGGDQGPAWRRWVLPTDRRPGRKTGYGAYMPTVTTRSGAHAGQSTSARYGREHYRKLAARSARQRQARNELRDQAIQHMLDGGWKIPTIISLTWDDLPRLGEYLSNGLGEYLEGERPDTDSDHLFVSRIGQATGIGQYLCGHETLPGAPPKVGCRGQARIRTYLPYRSCDLTGAQKCGILLAAKQASVRTLTAEAYKHHGFESRQANRLVAEWTKAHRSDRPVCVAIHRFWNLYEPMS